MSEDGKIFNAKNAQKKALDTVGNITEGVNTMRKSETYQQGVDMKNALAKRFTGMDEDQRRKKAAEAYDATKSFGLGAFRNVGRMVKNTIKTGRNPENEPVGGRKTKKSRRNKRKSTRKTRKNKRKTKKSKKSKRKSRKTRRK